jgi:hypothetical protein
MRQSAIGNKFRVAQGRLLISTLVSPLTIHHCPLTIAQKNKWRES